MKKFLALAAFAALVFGVSSCKDKEEPVYKINVQLVNEGQNYAIENVKVSLTDGAALYESFTDSLGVATFKVIAGSYTATTNFSDNMVIYNGTNDAVLVNAKALDFTLSLVKSKGSQIIIKEAYFGGCFDEATETKYAKDAYMIIYNNSQFEADATDLIFSLVGPARAVSASKYYSGEPATLTYENLGWIPAHGGFFWFSNEMKMAPYSQIVVVLFNATDHTNVETGGLACSVDLSKPEYYWMNGTDVKGYGDPKYIVSDNISKAHYLDGAKINGMKSWGLDITQPAIFIGKMNREDAAALAANTADYDITLGPATMLGCAKFPQDNVLDGIEVFQTGSENLSYSRFPASINTGYVSMTGYLGHSLYRNVNQEATEALAENDGKLVYNYDGAVDKELDICKIDAEKSIANGAHIIYSDTNNSGLDFHERAVASLKK